MEILENFLAGGLAVSTVNRLERDFLSAMVSFLFLFFQYLFQSYFSLFKIHFLLDGKLFPICILPILGMKLFFDRVFLADF